ncbi:MAG: right-handed parallel beta-helix repeat-containing protein [Myxococcota bacterium]|nr:right-handed parallel beta-helix repeat-containing protein [Myxococcota bacterium]
MDAFHCLRSLWPVVLLVATACGTGSSDTAPTDTESSALPEDDTENDTETGAVDTQDLDTAIPDTGNNDSGETPEPLACVVQEEGCDRILLANDQQQLLLQGSGYWADTGIDHSGETVCIPSGEYSVLNLSGLTGTADAPVHIQNCGEGQVVVDAAGQYPALSAWGARFVHLAGNGDPSHPYGFVFKNPGAGLAVVDMREGSTDITLEHIEVSGPAYSGIAIRTYPYCKSEFARGTFTQRNTVIRHSYVHDVSGEGLYIGPSHYDHDHSPTSTEDCAPGYPEASLSGVEIAYNRVENTGRDGIQVGAATEGVNIHHNVVRNYAMLESYGHIAGIQLNPGTVGRIHANWIESKAGSEIDNAFQIVGGDTGPLLLYNNVIVGTRIPFMALVRMGSPDHPTQILNNTVHGRSDGGRSLYIFCKSEFQQPFTVRNNLFVGHEWVGYPIWTDSEGQTYSKIVDANAENCPINGTPYGNGPDPDLAVPGNFYSTEIPAAGFVDPTGRDYHLTADSPAVGTGVNLSGIFTEDHDGLERGSGPYDLGAYRY